MLYKLPNDMVDFLTDHPMAVSTIEANIIRMMRTSATTRDDLKQVAKMCPECGEYNTLSMREKVHKYTCSRRPLSSSKCENNR